MMSLPPSGMASRALSARLRIAVASWLGSTIAGHASSSNTDSISTCSPSVAPQQLGGIDDQRVDVGLPRLERLLAGERQQMLGELGAARGGLVDHPRDGGELRLALDGIGQDFDRAR